MARKRPDQIDIDTTADALRGRRGRIFARAVGAGFRSDGNTLEIFDEIGPEGISDRAISAQLANMRGDISVKINSPGGRVDHAIAAFNLLTRYPGAVNVEIVGVAASAASLIAMAGDSIAIARNGFAMIHRVWGLTIGNAGDHSKQADTLQRFDVSLARTYAARSGQPIKTISEWMDNETWLDGEAAVRAGLADTILRESAHAAKFDLSIYARAPESLKPSKPETSSARIESRSHLERELRDKLGLAHAAARKVASAGFAALVGTPQTEIEELAESVVKATEELRNAN